MLKKQSEISLKAVLLSALFLSVTVATLLFLFLNYSNSFKPVGSNDRLNELYEKGEPEQALFELKKRPNVERGSGESLLWEGKLWYLTAFKRFEEEQWGDYAKNRDDWFIGKDIDKAIHSLSRAEKVPAQQEEALLILAIIYMEKGWFAKSTTKFSELLKEYPKNREAILNYGVLLSREHKFEKAAAVLKKGVSIYPKDSGFYKNLFWIYKFHLEDYEQAIYYGDKFLKNSDRSNPSLSSVKNDIYDILIRFPEFENDSLEIYSEDIREFTPRKRVTPFK
jgi:tetratricopeptide (TPR) repeat protein